MTGRSSAGSNGFVLSSTHPVRQVVRPHTKGASRIFRSIRYPRRLTSLFNSSCHGSAPLETGGKWTRSPVLPFTTQRTAGPDSGRLSFDPSQKPSSVVRLVSQSLSLRLGCDMIGMSEDIVESCTPLYRVPLRSLLAQVQRLCDWRSLGPSIST